MEKSLPIDSMWPMLVSRRMLRNGKLRGDIHNASCDERKARLLLDSMYSGLSVGVSDTFISLLDAMNDYVEKSRDTTVMKLLQDIKKDLFLGGQQPSISDRTVHGNMVVWQHPPLYIVCTS